VSVRRLRDLADAEESAWCDPRDPALWRRIATVWQLSARLAPRRFPPGVYKHRSIDDANRLAALWEAEHIAARRRPRT
jgi:hypothetical protein